MCNLVRMDGPPAPQLIWMQSYNEHYQHCCPNIASSTGPLSTSKLGTHVDAAPELRLPIAQRGMHRGDQGEGNA
jgi:hypothetical protein